ncbi:hypothetical protein TIFTF001_010445 [Ficus carica]|uniref:Lipoyl-binding domain-containing protein n=1 Tax=Ficus carica TaxID=3494 RepID=A0AA88D218_FICCA|nr:hypothetical protein TIFTF001_010445 [Ficus carica]
MESSAVLRSFQCSVDTVSLARSFLEKPGMVPVYNVRQINANRSCVPSLTTSGRLIYSSKKQKGFLVSCVKTSEAKEAAKSNGESSYFETGQHGYLNYVPQGSLEKTPRSATFPNGFEALMLEVCDETEIAELKLKVNFKTLLNYLVSLKTHSCFITAAHGAYSSNPSAVAMWQICKRTRTCQLEKSIKSRDLSREVGYLLDDPPSYNRGLKLILSKSAKERGKLLIERSCVSSSDGSWKYLRILQYGVGDFEMNLKRNVGATVAPLSHISPTSPPPIPTKPMVESAPAALPPSPPKTSPQNTSPFANVSLVKSSKLAALEASGSNAYVLVSSPTVGSFRRGRTVKGKKQPPICKEGDVIKEGQVIGYVDQFGTELPVKSDVGGEVLKVLFTEGEAVGYGDPLIAVLPSFHAHSVNKCPVIVAGDL